jgi:hypothetical protein
MTGFDDGTRPPLRRVHPHPLWMSFKSWKFQTLLPFPLGVRQHLLTTLPGIVMKFNVTLTLRRQ